MIVEVRFVGTTGAKYSLEIYLLLIWGMPKTYFKLVLSRLGIDF